MNPTLFQVVHAHVQQVHVQDAKLLVMTLEAHIQSATNQFGCGYCRRKGGPAELRAFVEQRETRIV